MVAIADLVIYDGSGRFRGSLVVKDDGDRPMIVHIQLGMLAGPPAG